MDDIIMSCCTISVCVIYRSRVRPYLLSTPIPLSHLTIHHDHKSLYQNRFNRYRKNANAQAHSDDGSDDSLNNDSNLHINGNGNGNTDNGVLSGTMDWFRSADSSESKPRRVMSVPNFHFEGNNDTVSAFNPVSGSGHANFTTETNTSKKSRVYDMTVRNNKRALKRSQSAMNINDMGDMREYDSFANDDFAASDLLLQFAFKVNEATRTEPPKQMVAPLAHVPHAPQSSIQSSIQSSHPQSSIQSSVQRHKKKRLSIDNTDNARSNGSNSGNSGNSRSGNKSGSLGPSPTSIAQDFMPDIHTTGVSVSTAPGSGLSTGYVESESLTRSYSPFTGNINEAVNARTGTNASNEITENTTTSPSSVSSQVVKQVVEEDRSASPGLDIDPGTDSSGSSSDTTSSSGRSGSENKKGKYLGFKKNVNMMHQTQNQTHQPTPMVLSRIK